MFRHRFLSALVLVPSIILLTLLGKGWFLALLATALSLAAREYAQIAEQGGLRVSVVLLCGFIWALLLAAYYYPRDMVWPAAAAFVLITMLWAMARFERGAPTAVSDWAMTLTGGLYLGVIGAHFILLRQVAASVDGQMAPLGLNLTLLALTAAWLADTGAYAVGKLWGRRKLSQRLSPGKTWEGYAGGLLAGVLTGGAWPWIIQAAGLPQLPGSPWGHGLALGALVAIFAPLGDLGESMLKRWANVKDSSNLIPGHGGVLDRMDTLLWAVVIVYYYAIWVI